MGFPSRDCQCQLQVYHYEFEVQFRTYYQMEIIFKAIFSLIYTTVLWNKICKIKRFYDKLKW